METVFLKRGSVYSQTESNFEVLNHLDKGIYQINQNPQTGELFLVRIADNFHFGFKLYGLDQTLITHVLDTYNKQSVKKNLGILLNGAKGTGKTVTAKVLANRLDLPVILCERPYGGLSRFLASINQDCIFFFDEFEKNFRLKCDDNEDCAGEDLLSIMDGVYNADHCHIFMLTTNQLRINDNLISRPSRIRYLKSFGEVIDRTILEEFVDDNLIYPEYKDEIMDFVDTLTMATIDIVKSIVEEINIHKCGVDTFKGFFNVKEASYHYLTRTWSYEKYDPDAMSKNEFLERCSHGFYSNDGRRPSYESLTLKKPIKSIKIGDMITSRYKVIELDLAKGYILCNDVRCQGYDEHIFIENVNATPTLYSNCSETYGYSDYDW
jgi:hypothetical protein